ncbi:phage neck terminator protein [Acetobacter indonesiensis]|uniref:Phage neck terminator protein gp12-like domain-containing protein n=1 Tax=Acetobacter indonesiensis TaxID=104101 RepID=A0A252AL33_9PROT|nr:hypothetical protein [Acetobacter indonesiensis]OUI90173.1 hypothetical protein HK17_14180 [Acetobacter indonesiensis]
MVQGRSNPPDITAPGLLVTPSEQDIYTVVKAWITSVLPFPVIIRQGQQNDVAAPADPFMLMTIIGRERIATNGWTYTDTARVVVEQTRIAIQISAFGKGSGNLIQSVLMLWRDMNAVDYFKSSGFPIAPLHTSDIRQLGFINAEKNYEDCWSVDLILQANITTQVPQQYANKLTIDTLEVDTTYPPKE